MTEEECAEAMYGMGHPGVCLACDYYDEYAGCEPDAENYECPECGDSVEMEHHLIGDESYDICPNCEAVIR